jgi:hypothetical protein
MTRDHLAQLPLRRAETWQGAVTRLPIWIEPPDAAPFRPDGAVWARSEGAAAWVERSIERRSARTAGRGVRRAREPRRP